MNKSKIIIACISLALAVGFGAFGAHGLKFQISANNLEIFKTGNFYHFVHGIGLFIVILLSKGYGLKELKMSFNLLLSGIVLFSGSLYLLALRDIFTFLPRWLGALTPIGGILYILGWLSIGYYAYKGEGK